MKRQQSHARTLITGASNGIGLALARKFASRGHDLIIVARSDTRLHELQTEIEAQSGQRVAVIALDLSTSGAAAELKAQVDRLGLGVEILVNNAGFGLFGAFSETDWSKESEMLRLNVLTLTELCKLFIPQMLVRGRGRILNVASTAAFQPGPLMAVYYASKAYVLHFSEAIAEELTGSGVTVTALCPGPTRSGFQSKAEMEESRIVKDRQLPSSEEVAEYAYRSLMAGRRVAIHGFSNFLLAQSVRLAPRTLIAKIAKRIQSTNP